MLVCGLVGWRFIYRSNLRSTLAQTQRVSYKCPLVTLPSSEVMYWKKWLLQKRLYYVNGYVVRFSQVGTGIDVRVSFLRTCFSPQCL